MTVAQAARTYRTTPRTIRAWTTQERIRSWHDGRTTLVDSREIEHMLRVRRVAPRHLPNLTQST